MSNKTAGGDKQRGTLDIRDNTSAVLALLDPRELNRQDVPLIAARVRDYFEDHAPGVP